MTSAAVRRAALAVAMAPPWVVYLAALLGLADRWGIDREGLRLAMGVEFLSVLFFPLLGGIAATPDRDPGLRWVRWAACLILAIAVTEFVVQGLGERGAVLFWLGSGFTYIGWLWAPPGEARWQTLLSRFLLTFASLFPIILAVIVLAKLTGRDEVLLMGFLYFAALQALELGGAFERFHRAFTRLRG